MRVIGIRIDRTGGIPLIGEKEIDEDRRGIVLSDEPLGRVHVDIEHTPLHDATLVIHLSPFALFQLVLRLSSRLVVLENELFRVLHFAQ